MKDPIPPKKLNLKTTIKQAKMEGKSMEYVDYLQNMKNCKQFFYINIEPVWVPGTQDIAGFIQDEVVRQGHDPRVRSDGGLRVEWMTSAWNYALRTAQHQSAPSLQDVLNMGALVEPFENKAGFRTSNIYIRGELAGTKPIDIPRAMLRLFEGVGDVEPVTGKNSPKGMTADEFYLEYEHIHPFGDGNGRTGKIVWNWLMGTLDDPMLIDDYFGGNP